MYQVGCQRIRVRIKPGLHRVQSLMLLRLFNPSSGVHSYREVAIYYIECTPLLLCFVCSVFRIGYDTVKKACDTTPAGVIRARTSDVCAIFPYLKLRARTSASSGVHPYREVTIYYIECTPLLPFWGWSVFRIGDGTLSMEGGLELRTVCPCQSTRSSAM